MWQALKGSHTKEYIDNFSFEYSFDCARRRLFHANIHQSRYTPTHFTSISEWRVIISKWKDIFYITTNFLLVSSSQNWKGGLGGALVYFVFVYNKYTVYLCHCQCDDDEASRRREQNRGGGVGQHCRLTAHAILVLRANCAIHNPQSATLACAA